MRTFGTFLSYAAGIAVLAGGVAVAASFVPSQTAANQSAQSPQPAEPKLSSSPRIAAWQERIAEEKIYAQRQVEREAEEKARWAAIGKPPVTQALTAAQERELEARERARAQEARREAERRAQEQYAQQSDPFGFAATAYAPARNRSRYNYIYSTMRESRGGN
jgi:hypothetical protein